MNRFSHCLAGCLLGAILAPATVSSQVIHQETSPYHHIKVRDAGGLRFLHFDNSQQSRMSLANPLQGHFEYIEYFHMPWLWNPKLTNVLMIGLGGASAQRAYQHYYPDIRVETAELDPRVVEVARNYFGLKESASNRVEVADGRVYVRRSTATFDAIILDPYTESRYGTSIPYHLATREFFELINKRLATNGVVAYNVIGSPNGWNADVLGSMYQTMKSVFPQVYLFPARESMNTVVIAVKSTNRLTQAQLNEQANSLIASGRIKLPTFRTRFQALCIDPPAGFAKSQVLTDDFAPIDGMLSRGK